MTRNTLLQFGERKAGAKYIDRPGAYAVVFKDPAHLLVLKLRNGSYYLPGGGQEDHETPMECVLRELFEETRVQGKIIRELGHANQYVFSSDQQRFFNLLGVFFLVSTQTQIAQQTEPHHAPCYIPIAEALANLPGFHAWAVKQTMIG